MDISESENKRLNVDNIARPNKKWSFVWHIIADLKIILENGLLPDNLR